MAPAVTTSWRPPPRDRKITSTVARHGTTSLVATTVTAPLEDTCHSLEGIARYIRIKRNTESTRASPPKSSGMHLEGPFISKARRGVHPADSIHALH